MLIIILMTLISCTPLHAMDTSSSATAANPQQKSNERIPIDHKNLKLQEILYHLSEGAISGSLSNRWGVDVQSYLGSYREILDIEAPVDFKNLEVPLSHRGFAQDVTPCSNSCFSAEHSLYEHNQNMKRKLEAQLLIASTESGSAPRGLYTDLNPQRTEKTYIEMQLQILHYIIARFNEYILSRREHLVSQARQEKMISFFIPAAGFIAIAGLLWMHFSDKRSQRD